VVIKSSGLRISPKRLEGQGEGEAQGAQEAFELEPASGCDARFPQTALGVVVDPSVSQQKLPAVLPVPGDVLAHDRQKDAIPARLMGQGEEHFEVSALAWRQVARRSLTSPVHDQRAGVRIEDLVADRPTLFDAPGLVRAVRDIEARANAASAVEGANDILEFHHARFTRKAG
jgi:hypothetical protein